MSSGVVRDALRTALETVASPWPVFDISDYVSFDDVLGNVDERAVLIQHVASDETPTTVAGGSLHGWSEDSSPVIHLVVASGFDAAPVVQKGDEIREALRGTRLTDEIVIQSFAPFVDFAGLGLYGTAWKGWSANVFINRRDCR